MAAARSIAGRSRPSPAIRDETPTVRTFTLAAPRLARPSARPARRPPADRRGRLQVERSYSIASEPERDGEIDLTVERIDDGEVSPFLHDVVVVGDRFEVRGPIGGYFVWEAALRRTAAPRRAAARASCR